MTKIYGFWFHKNDNPWDRAPPWAIELREQLNDLQKLVSTVVKKETAIMASIDDAIAEVAAQNTALGSVKTLITTIEGQLQAALSGASLPPAVQAKVDQLFSSLQSNDQVIADALAAGVPPPPATGS